MAVIAVCVAVVVVAVVVIGWVGFVAVRVVIVVMVVGLFARDRVYAWGVGQDGERRTEQAKASDEREDGSQRGVHDFGSS